MADDWSDEETDNPALADDRNYYKVEKWTKDGTKGRRMLYAGNGLDKAREILAEAIKHGPGIHLTIRQRTRVLERFRELQRSKLMRAPGVRACGGGSV
jgi:hypothetical protein